MAYGSEIPSGFMHSHIHTYGEFRLSLGSALPLGASLVPQGVNFSVFSAHATGCVLVLFRLGEDKPYAEIPFPFRLGQIFAMTVLDLKSEEFEYGFRMEGPFNPEEGHLFDRKHILLDPEARVISGCNVWDEKTEKGRIFRARMPLKSMREEERGVENLPLCFPSNELVIYEMHVRGFTRHSSSEVKHAGTFEGMKEKIPYLQELGINCVELMPIFEFDELENTRTNPLTGGQLHNYWGYNTVGFYAPKAGFAAKGCENLQAEELKSLICKLHQAGIRVLLDVVFNHTAEGNTPFSFRGLDNKTYYLMDESGRDIDYTGCGNTFRCGHPVVRRFIVDCLRYWATEFRVDGFRFDLASVLGRDLEGMPLENPPLLEEIAYDPVLADCELIAEPWDARGLYQVGDFPAYRRWKEWNGKYRDCARRFLKGELGTVGEMVQRILGSPDLYAASERGPTASINFITCHDGFTLADLFSYNEKHNLENGEENHDGDQANYSWNCGVEGETTDPQILALRWRLQRNAIALLFVSQGIPMISLGDECGRTQRGNNNAYCHDESWNWLDWTLLKKNADFFRFVRNMIAFRKANPVLSQSKFLSGMDLIGSGYPDISWHGVEPWRPDWSESSQSLAFLLCGSHAGTLGGPGNFVYCAFNSFYENLTFGLPVLPKGMVWHQFVNTGSSSPEDICEVGAEKLLEKQEEIGLIERSCVILLGKYRDGEME